MTFSIDTSTVFSLGVASLVGLAVGIEREWSGNQAAAHPRFAGVRTFLILGLLGGLSGVSLLAGWTAIGTILLAAGTVLVLIAYFVASQPPAGVDGTTEAAALVVLALGVFAGQGYYTLAAGVCAVVVLALREKAELHRLVHRLGEAELKAAIQFAVLALVVLPLLPEGPYGPLGGVRPRSLWTVVLILSALNFAGYLARRIAGPGLGYPITGALGGLVSSTAVTLQFSRLSRREPKMAGPLSLGVVAACTVLLPRVTAISAILNPDVARALLPYLIPPLVAGIGILAWALLRHRRRDAGKTEFVDKSPLRLWSAIQMAIAFQAVLMIFALVRQWWGTPSIIPSAALVGLTDVDALTFSMSRLGTSADMVGLAARGIAVGILANTLLKMTIALVLGSPGYRWRAAAGLVALGATMGAGLWLRAW
ncbi:MAG TPA: MgtC/SapB family protein [Gemmatimonadales bacterium]|nr:MgtC/SapB family protein [Gemmatimonadales bacterium]